MKLSEFKIGETFFCGGNTWRCTERDSKKWRSFFQTAISLNLNLL
jgi:hypothetical protein